MKFLKKPWKSATIEWILFSSYVFVSCFSFILLTVQKWIFKLYSVIRTWPLLRVTTMTACEKDSRTSYRRVGRCLQFQCYLQFSPVSCIVVSRLTWVNKNFFMERKKLIWYVFNRCVQFLVCSHSNLVSFEAIWCIVRPKGIARWEG